MGFSRQEYWGELPFPSPGNLPSPGIQPAVEHVSSVWQADSSPLSHQGSPVYVWLIHLVIQQKLTEHCKANIIVVIQSLSCVQLFSTPWTAACQASLSINNSQSLLKLMSIDFMIPPNHLNICHPLLLLPSIFPRIGFFFSELALCIRWPKGWSFSFSISPSKSIQGLFPLDWLVWSLCCPRDSQESSSTSQLKSINCLVLSLLYIQLISILWRRQWQPTPVLLPGKSHGQKSLVGCSPWGREESDVESCIRHYWQNGGTAPATSPQQARSRDEGFRFCDSDCSFLSLVELAGKNVKVLIVLERSMRKHKAFCSCVQKIIYKVTVDICSRIFTKNVPGWAHRPQLEAMGRIVIWDLFVWGMFMAKEVCWA